MWSNCYGLLWNRLKVWTSNHYKYNDYKKTNSVQHIWFFHSESSDLTHLPIRVSGARKNVVGIVQQLNYWNSRHICTWVKKRFGQIWAIRDLSDSTRSGIHPLPQVNFDHTLLKKMTRETCLISLKVTGHRFQCNTRTKTSIPLSNWNWTN